jgi:hypothetical protein
VFYIKLKFWAVRQNFGSYNPNRSLSICVIRSKFVSYGTKFVFQTKKQTLSQAQMNWRSKQKKSELGTDGEGPTSRPNLPAEYAMRDVLRKKEEVVPLPHWTGPAATTVQTRRRIERCFQFMVVDTWLDVLEKMTKFLGLKKFPRANPSTFLQLCTTPAM